MNDDLDKIRECLTRIEALCTSPHWDSGRKNQIVELTSLAQAHLANYNRRFAELMHVPDPPDYSKLRRDR